MYMLVPAAGTRLESACRPVDQAATCHETCNGAVMKLRLMEQALRLLHGARWRRTPCACSSLPRALDWRVLAALSTRQFGFDGIYSNSLSSRTFTCGCLHDGDFVVVTYVVLGPCGCPNRVAGRSLGFRLP